MQKTASTIETQASQRENDPAKYGFTLVELSIVLVIVGLLAGGIVVGSDMIRASELRSVTADIESFQTATLTFKDRYLSLPGDFDNATTLWGAAHVTPATCVTTVSTGTQTCNGKGNNIIADMNGDAIEINEAFRFWQHLVNEGLLEGRYTGVAGTSNGRDADIGVNVPASKINGAGYSLTYVNTLTTAHGDRFMAENGRHQMDFGIDSVWEPYQGVLKPEEAWSMDTKFDDGKPATGNMVVWKNGGMMGQCTTTTDPLTSEYKLTTSTKDCGMIFLMNF